MDPSLQLSLAILSIPLVISIFLFIVRKRLSKPIIGGLASLSTLTIFCLSTILFINHYNKTPFSFSHKWIILPDLSYFSAGIYLNNIALIMLLLVSGISLLVQIFSLDYMKHDQSYGRYYSFLTFFTFSMIGIVMASNLLMIFIFWELVGFSSYLLIGFWYTKHSANQAAKKAFIVNRIGDIGFLLGILILWSLFNTLDFTELEIVAYLSSDVSPTLISLAGLGLFAGCIGKSAQFPLQVWLPDAMEGPTPVSALIHAATMVAAGVFLLARIFFILNLDILTVIAFVGGITAFMGAIAALTQYDIKKVLAYSTISQLGYMVMGMGISAYQASFFHLITHAFFKAGLFLSAGAIIHALHEATHHYEGENINVQDMRLMGGLRKFLPLTFICYCITTAALIGLPFTSGFLSKDAIISSSLAWANVMTAEIGFIGYLIPLLALITVLLTAFYMIRQIIMIFYGKFRMNDFLNVVQDPIKVKEAKLSMKIPLVILSVFSFFIFFSLNPFSLEHSNLFQSLGKDLRLLPGSIFIHRNIVLTDIEKSIPSFHWIGIVSSLSFAALGILWALKKYYKKEARESKSFLKDLSFNNWFLDRFYHKWVVTAVDHSSILITKIDSKIIDPILHFLGYFTVISAICVKGFDKIIVDGVVNFSVYVTSRMGLLARSFQGGKVQFYFIVAIISLVTMILLIAF